MVERGADLKVDGIHTAYGLSQVLFGVSLEAKAGECIALIGRNGVGKTTTMRSIMGLTPPSSGRVMWVRSRMRTMTSASRSLTESCPMPLTVLV